MTVEENLDCELSTHFIKGVKRVDLNECFSGAKCDLEVKLVDLVSNFVEKSCAINCYRPLPPMLSNGESIDLHKLYDVVKKKGGFDPISKNGLWDEVGLVYGLGPGLGSSIKLIYLKYLKSLESWLVKLHKESGNLALSEEALMELQSDYNGFVSKFSDEMRKNDKCFVVKMSKSDNSFVDSCNVDDNDEKIKRKKLDLNFADFVDLCEEDGDGNLKIKRKKIGRSMANDAVELTEDNKDIVKPNNSKWGLEQVASKVSFKYDNFLTQSDSRRSSIGEGVLVDNVVNSSENSNASMKYLTEVEGKFISVDSSVLKEEVYVRNTRHDSLLKMVQWLTNVAKDPTDPEIGVIPESSKWAKFENHNEWKQVLLAREAIFMKRSQVSVTDIWQKKQRMHPSMFEDQIEATTRPRSSSRLLFVNVPNSYSSSPRASHYIGMNQGRPSQRLGARLDLQPRGLIYTSRPQQRIPVGPQFQAQVPEWTGVPSRSNPKWLGTRVWPLETVNGSVYESDSIGKGRVDGCGCASSSSPECVKLHVAERSRVLEVELESAFYVWNFHKMGERCSISWTSDEEMKFKNVVKENPLSLQKFFWLEMSKALPRKTWTDLVNYYFNVFVLRRRGYQNRLALNDIDSDNDETEYRFAARYLTNSSSKKGHLNIK